MKRYSILNILEILRLSFSFQGTQYSLNLWRKVETKDIIQQSMNITYGKDLP